MKKVLIILLVLAFLLPHLFLFVVAFALPSQYTNTFYGELNEKYDRLYSLEEDKIVVVGGSSVAFGLNSDMLSAYMHMPVVNFGLYADLGTKVMLDLSLDAIEEGDIVVLAPELDPQTLSLFFNGESVLKAADDDPSLLFDLKWENVADIYSGLWSFVGSKLSYLFGEKPDPDGVYNSKNFNEAGDVIYDRPENIMPAYYDPFTELLLSEEIFSDDFVAYLNDYIDAVHEKGAKVYYNYCPLNEMAVVTPVLKDENGNILYTEQKEPMRMPLSDAVLAFDTYLSDTFDVDAVFGMTEQGGTYALSSMMGAGYFYDSNLHLNNAGVVKNTLSLVENLYLYTYGTAPVLTDTVPEEPTLPYRDEIDAETVTYGDFLLSMQPNGSYAVVGVSEEGLTKNTLILPPIYVDETGKQAYISTLGMNAFSACTVTENLVLSPEMHLSNIQRSAFDGTSITSVYLFSSPSGSQISNILDGTPEGFAFRIPSEYYSMYYTDYFWSAHPHLLAHSDLTYEDACALQTAADSEGAGMDALTVTFLSIVGAGALVGIGYIVYTVAESKKKAARQKATD